ncbi:hypothetical protein LCGC14_2537590 [marine sediment metagenome]|uniref:Uncharacterized protein n=1 Tax=marine sediment metagenome TaxID=412755 RepID=A0A0F9DJR1_9ZZZZ
MKNTDIAKMMRRKGFTCVCGDDLDRNVCFALFQHEATRLSCITMEPGRYSHVPIHPSLFHKAETMNEALMLAADAAIREVPE